jgi:GTP-binding protein HflX
MSRLHGKTLGLKAGQVRAIERLLHRRIDPDLPVSYDLAREMSQLAAETRRRIGVLLDRRGRINDVFVGDALRVPVPDLWNDRVAPNRLRGVRLVLTAFTAAEIPSRDLQLLSRFRFDLLIQVEADAEGEPTVLRMAALSPDPERQGPHQVFAPLPASGLRPGFLDQVSALEEELARRVSRVRRSGTRSAALLLSVHRGPRAPAEESMRELRELARSALLEVAAEEFQRRPHPDPRSLVGKGKIEGIVQRAWQVGATVLVVDGELSPTQARNLDKETGLSVIDRTDLILSIFERRARSRDAKLRVELARMRYELPRLAGGDESFSRIGRAGAGGAGVRGKGERRLELDRRRMRERIHRLEGELVRLGRRGQQGRRRRVQNVVPVVALVGYTNAGKSTLMNAMTDADVLAEDLLFATLDTTTRKLLLPSGRAAVLVDTVGFLRALPEELRDAFRATLEELGEADLLVHLVDAADRDFADKQKAVELILEDLGLSDRPRLTLFNKADLVNREEFAPIARALGGEVFSATDKDDRARLRESIDEALGARARG